MKLKKYFNRSFIDLYETPVWRFVLGNHYTLYCDSLDVVLANYYCDFYNDDVTFLGVFDSLESASFAFNDFINSLVEEV